MAVDPERGFAGVILSSRVGEYQPSFVAIFELMETMSAGGLGG